MMISRAWLVLGCACLSACGKDVQLGVGPDAAIPIDSEPGAFVPGAYALSFLDPIDISCDGSLTGNESSFTTITRASANLVDGTVTLTMPSQNVLSISGAVITTAFGQPSLDLVPDPAALPPDFPQTIWDTSVTKDFGSGPLGTLHVARYFGVDSATAVTPTAMQAAVALLYETADSTGGCYGTVAAVLASQ